MSEIKAGDLVTMRAFAQETATTFVVLHVESQDGVMFAHIAFEQFSSITQHRIPLVALELVGE